MPVPRLLLATHSADKAREIRHVLAGTRLELVTLAELGVEPSPDEDAVEAYPTFQENALAKARYFLERTGIATLSDDSGLCVDALGGAPGVRSKRFADDHAAPGDDPRLPTDERNNRLLLIRLEGVASDRRTARYLCAAAVALPGTDGVVTLGACEGRILATPSGHGGFGYDPLFAPTGSDHSFGESSAAEKNRISHRARAFRAIAALAPWLSRRVDSAHLRR